MQQKTPIGDLALFIIRSAALFMQGISLILFVVFTMLFFNTLIGHPDLPVWASMPFGFGSIIFLFAFLVGIRVSSMIRKIEEDTKDKSE